MPEEKTTVETSEEKTDWAESEKPVLPDLTDETQTEEETGEEVSEETPAKTETEEMAETKTETSEKADIESLDETDLLKKFGFEDYAEKGGIEAVLKDYSEGRKGFTQERQKESELKKTLRDLGITGDAPLPQLIEEAVKKATTPQVEPSEKAYQEFLKESGLKEEEATEKGWSKAYFKTIRKITGVDQLEQQNAQLISAMGAFLPLLQEKWYNSLVSTSETKGRKVLASLDELTDILNSNPDILRRAGETKSNPMQEAYGRYLLENKGEELFKFVYEAGQKKQQQQQQKMVNAKKVEKPGGKSTLIAKHWQDLTPEEFERLPSAEQEKIVNTPEYKKFLAKAFQVH